MVLEQFITLWGSREFLELRSRNLHLGGGGPVQKMNPNLGDIEKCPIYPWKIPGCGTVTEKSLFFAQELWC